MIKVAFIGLGNIAQAHLKFLTKQHNARVHGLCDINKTTLEKRRREFGGTPFTNYQAMLDQIKPDAVWLCTPPAIRRMPLLACAQRKIPVFCEKPVAMHENTAVQIERDLRAMTTMVQIGYVFRSMPAVQRLRTLMRDDKIHLVQSLYTCNASLAMNLPAWLYNKSKSGGILIEQGTHNLDLLRYLFGEAKEIRGCAANAVRPKHGNYTIDETAAVLLRFTNNTIASHLHTWVGNTWHNEIIVIGEKRTYCLYPNRGLLLVKEPANDSEPLISRQRPKASGKEYRFQQDARPIYEYEDCKFLNIVRTGKWQDNPCSFNDGLKSLQLAWACERALRQKQS